MKTFDKMRKEIGEFLKGPEGSKLWDLMCCLRGPDSPSERPDMGAKERDVAYAGRRARKRATVEVVREKAFFGVIGGAARHHDADYVTLPPQEEWDHFDHHVQRAAGVLGLRVEVEGGKREGVKVEVNEKKGPLLPNDIEEVEEEFEEEDDDIVN